MRKKVLVFLLFIFLFGGVAGVIAVEEGFVDIGEPAILNDCVEDCIAKPIVSEGSGLVAFGPREDLLALINNFRVSRGLSPWSFNSQINTAALLHSNDMLANDYFSHYSQNGDAPWDRMNDAGFYGGNYGENIAAHSGSPDAALCFELWYNSPPHYSLMISPNFNVAGIGIASGNWYNEEWGGTYYSTIYTLDVGRQNVVCNHGDTRQCGVSDVGRCGYGVQTCIDGNWASCQGAVLPIAEICGNLIDDDCDSDTDEFCNCISHDYSNCFNGDAYWYDSCDRREDRKEDCRQGCVSGECVVCDSHDSFKCYGSDVYWYDGCNRREERKEDCAEGCVGDVCVVCGSHDSFRCYGSDVYWYDSCNHREDRQEDCLYGCNDGECNAPPCGDIDEDGFKSVDCGGNDCDDSNAMVYPGSVEVCNDIDENCNDVIDEECVENFVIVSPENGDLFTTRRVLVDLEIAHLDGRVWYSVDRGRERIFCSNVDRCEKSISLSDGHHDLEFYIKDPSGDMLDGEEVFIFVDSKKPKIRRTEPRKYASGKFNFRFREANPEHVILHYGEDEYYVDPEECHEDRRDQACEVFIDISKYNGEEIEYWLEVEDIAGNLVESRKTEVIVDTDDPVINNIETEVNRRRVYFTFDIDEENFKGIEYINHADRTPRWRRLCTRLRDGICEKSRSFSVGVHELDLRVLDKAGNEVLDSVEFEI